VQQSIKSFACISYALSPVSPFCQPTITGKHVVLQLLQKKQNVKAIVRSKEKLINSIDDISAGKSSRDLNIVSRLDTTEASLLDLSQDELDKVRSCISVYMSCYNALMLQCPYAYDNTPHDLSRKI